MSVTILQIATGGKFPFAFGSPAATVIWLREVETQCSCAEAVVRLKRKAQFV